VQWTCQLARFVWGWLQVRELALLSRVAVLLAILTSTFLLL